MLQGARAKLSQDLVALWADDYPPALALLRRVFPPGLLRFLQQKRSPSVLSRPTSPTPQPVRPAGPAHRRQHEKACGRKRQHGNKDRLPVAGRPS